jgi:uncharacterized membrane protein
MVSTLLEILNVGLRWLHIASVATLVGGMIYARAAMIPALNSISAESRAAVNGIALARFRRLVWAASLGVILSGLYNFLAAPGHTARYHMLFGIKMLLVGHVLAAAFLATRPVSSPDQGTRRPRMLAGAAISGLIIILISAYLRRIF